MNTQTQTEVSETAAIQIAQRVMHGVANLFRQANVLPRDYDKATQIIRDEVKTFLFDASYADERDCLLRGSLPEQTILMSVCLSAFSKIRQA